MDISIIRYIVLELFGEVGSHDSGRHGANLRWVGQLDQNNYALFVWAYQPNLLAIQHCFSFAINYNKLTNSNFCYDLLAKRIRWYKIPMMWPAPGADLRGGWCPSVPGSGSLWIHELHSNQWLLVASNFKLFEHPVQAKKRDVSACLVHHLSINWPVWSGVYGLSVCIFLYSFLFFTRLIKIRQKLFVLACVLVASPLSVCAKWTIRWRHFC